MPIELPRFEDGRGLMLCLCGELETTDSIPKAQAAQVFKYSTPQGNVFLRAEIRGKLKRSLYINCARAAWFGEGPLPKITAKQKEDVTRIIGSADGLKLQATVCASFSVPLEELPESGLIRSLLMESKGANTPISIKMTGASFAFTGAPVNLLKWRTVSTKEKTTTAHIDLRGKRELLVSDTCLTEVWRWIYDTFALWVLGRGEADPSPKAK
jgi:hypothetical protein